MFDSVIKLIKVTETRNAFGGLVRSETEREVFCEVQSVSRSEFYSAAEAGLSVSRVFLTPAINYDGETIVEYMGTRYGVTRTYQTDADQLYIYVGEKVGAYGS